MQARSRVPCLCCGASCMPSERCSVFLQLWHICGPSSKGSRSARQDRQVCCLLWHKADMLLETPRCPLSGVKPTFLQLTTVHHLNFVLIGERREGDSHKRHKGEHGVDRVRILPLSPHRLEVLWGDGHGIGESPE